MIAPQECTLCPRLCKADRAAGQPGICGGADKLRVARAALHQWEEPCISGIKGSGTVFFSGCPLGCCFCQNRTISTEGVGQEISTQRLAEIFWELQDQGAHNINLVTPLHWAPWLAKALSIARSRLFIPVVCNTSGYEKIETLKRMEGLIDIYLPDVKFYARELAARYANAPDYFNVASRAVLEMYRQTGPICFTRDNMLSRGVIVRHLALPKAHHDGKKILDWFAKSFPKGEVLLSLMSQYTPPAQPLAFSELNRRISSFEYRMLLEHAQLLGIKGFMQERSAAKEKYTPLFDLTGI